MKINAAGGFGELINDARFWFFLNQLFLLNAKAKSCDDPGWVVKMMDIFISKVEECFDPSGRKFLVDIAEEYKAEQHAVSGPDIPFGYEMVFSEKEDS
jgi:hypothetical protein